MKTPNVVIAILTVSIAAFAVIHGCKNEAKRSDALVTAIRNGEKNAPTQDPTSSEGAAGKPGNAIATGLRWNDLSTPITFYGKVIDQFGEPVSMAIVKYDTNDNLSGLGTKHSTKADNAGDFSIHGAGASLSVEVSKDGYYPIDFSPPWDKPGSSNGFAYAAVGGSKPHQPDVAHPVIFALHKQGKVEPLERLRSKSFDVPKSGSEVKINVAPQGSKALREITVKMWINDGKKTSLGTFDWSFEIAAIDGGLVPRSDKYNFTAPETGYEPAQKVSIPATLPRPQWEEVAERSYFVKFNDGAFARIDVTAFNSAGVEIKGYINPQTGSRNLESDPKKR